MNVLHLAKQVASCAAFVVLAAASHAEDDDDVDEAVHAGAPDAQRLREALAAPVRGGTPGEVARAYVERVRMARRLNDAERELREIRTGLDAVGRNVPAAYGLLNRLAEYENDRGDFVAGLQARQQALAVARVPSRELAQLNYMATLHARLRDREGAMSTLSRAQQVLQRLRAVPNWSRFGDQWQGSHSFAIGVVEKAFGSHAQSETAFRACIASMRLQLAKSPAVDAVTPFHLVACTSGLMDVLMADGRLEEAAALATEVKELAREFSQQQDRAAFEARMSPVRVRVEIERGRFGAARSLIEQSIAELRKTGAGEGSQYVAMLRYQEAAIEMLDGQWERADRIYTERQVGTLHPDWSYALLRMGQGTRALDMVKRSVASRHERYGDTTLHVWEARGFLALALAATGQRAQALREFSAAVPRIVELGHGERASAESGVLRATRLKWVLEGYLAALADAATRGEKAAGLDPVDEAFRVADLVRGSTVQLALANAASRAVIADPALAALSRQYHDRQRELGSLSDGLGSLLARGRVTSMDAVVERIRADLDTLRRDQTRVHREMEQRFPEYASLLEPRAPGIAQVQKLLRPGEVLVSLLVGQAHTYVWAVPHAGTASFAKAELSASQVARHVGQLRRRLDPGAVTDASRIPPFDFEASHALYRQLLAPVEPVLRDASSLIVVPHAELSTLPFAVLTTAPFTPAPGAAFDSYAKAPWLIERHAVSHLPSATALVSLRREPALVRWQRSFIGFADPVFAPGTSVGSGTRGFGLRTKAVADAAPLEASGPLSSQLHRLQPLPETADEIRDIGRSLGADEARDLYLRERATEANVKQADLAAYRVVMFATHGLVPGDLPGLSQPALALSNPALTGGRDDGLLQMDEVLNLKLKAEWVVLSACNTASAAGAEEAISGLGRAFFYAGARALLLTQWPIESDSARVLTSTMFRIQAQQAGIARSKALRQASMEMLNSAIHAHPIFWAPFVLVGEGG